MPDLNLLITLDVLLAEGSVARAAQRLRLSPSAMSRALARLRAATGDPLLVRAGRGLVPTPRALQLREQVSQLVQDAHAVLRPANTLDLGEVVRTFTLRTSEEFVERFGPGIVGPDGCLDRAALGEIVFSDAEARADLNAIVHPRVRARAREIEAAAPPGTMVAHIIPLLVETGQQDDYDGVLLVDAPDELREERLIRRNALTRQQARARIVAQATREERLAIADWVIDNAGTPEKTVAQVESWWACIRP